jgi:hypothetical protein
MADMGLFDRFRRSTPPPAKTPPLDTSPPAATTTPPAATSRAPSGPFPVGEQLAELERLGIRLSSAPSLPEVPGLDDDRGWIENQRFGLLQFLAVDHDQDGAVHTDPGVAYIHLEQAEGDDSYPYVLRVLARAAGRQGDLGAVTSRFDPDERDCRLDYELAGRTFSVEPDVQGDWLDGMAVGYIAEDLARPGQQCAWWIADGATWATWLPPVQAEELMQLMQSEAS